jgi:hypothetical protein
MYSVLSGSRGRQSDGFDALTMSATLGFGGSSLAPAAAAKRAQVAARIVCRKGKYAFFNVVSLAACGGPDHWMCDDDCNLENIKIKTFLPMKKIRREDEPAAIFGVGLMV